MIKHPELCIWLRDQGIKQVDENAVPWKDVAWSVLCWLPAGEWSADEINAIVERDAGRPHHPNAYGALIMRGVRSGVLKPTGRYRKSQRASCHAHKYQVYTKGTSHD